METINNPEESNKPETSVGSWINQNLFEQMTLDEEFVNEFNRLVEVT